MRSVINGNTVKLKEHVCMYTELHILDVYNVNLQISFRKETKIFYSEAYDFCKLKYLYICVVGNMIPIFIIKSKKSV